MVTRLVFFNPAAGSGLLARRARRLAERLATVPGTAVHPTERGAITDQVLRLLTPAVVRVYAIGGDGTVGDVAGALVDRPIAFGIIPCGTTNVLAREYGISLRAARAADQLEASTRTADLVAWRVGGHTAVLGAGVGWDARVMAKSPQAMKQQVGRAGIALIGLREIWRYEFPPLVARGPDGDGHPVELRGTSILLPTVKRWAGGNRGIPMADPADDFIDVVALEPRSRLHLLLFWALMTTPGGRPLRLPGVRTVKLRSVRVESADGRPIEVHVNGDAVAHTPMTMERAGIVRVLIP